MNFRQVHLDFHTSENIEGIGKDFDKAQFQAALKAGHVNSITLFSKCHHGWAYHPSKTNETHPHLDFDLLKAQIEAAHEIGVKTPVYLSAGFDEKAARQHPDWLAQNKEGTWANADSFSQPGYHVFCMNTPYLDYLLAQIKEAAQNYDADGIFLDIMSVRPCYCPHCIQTLLAEGKDPNNEEDIMELAERVYANYARRVRETIDSVKPGLPVFHNGGHIRRGRRDLVAANTHLELESLPTGGWGYDHFPMSARYVQTLGVEYLGMTGKFHKSWGEFGGFKHPNALRYETALSVANGAKCSIGDQLSPTGKFDMATYRLIGAAYQEIEEKEPWLDGVTPVADIAVLSMDAVLNEAGQNVSGANASTSDVGVSRMLLEGHYLFNIVDLDADLSGYKIVILPDSVRVTPAIRAKLAAFVKNGGKLLATGTSGLDSNNRFAFDFGAEWVCENPYNPDYIRPLFAYPNVDSTDYIIYAPGQKIQATTGRELAKRIDPYFNRTAKHFCSHLHAPSSGIDGGSGMVQGKDGIYLAWDIFADYAKNGSLIAKRLVCYALDQLLGDSVSLRTSLPAQGVVTLMDQTAQKRYVNHLLYAVPTKRGENVEIIEDIQPVYDLTVSLRLPRAIQGAYLAPQNTPLDFQQDGGRINITIPKLECHQMLVLDYE